MVKAENRRAYNLNAGRYLGFVYGQPVLADYTSCSEHLLAGLDADWSVRGQQAVANLMVGTLDNCLTRIGQRESAAAVREFAVGAGNIIPSQCAVSKRLHQLLCDPFHCRTDTSRAKLTLNIDLFGMARAVVWSVAAITIIIHTICRDMETQRPAE
eukprot:COSAG02_NODE_1154_length_14189_cov_10.515614_9_plen_156_part_00